MPRICEGLLCVGRCVFFLTRHRKTFGFFIRLGKQQDIFEMNFFSRFYCLNGIRWKYNQTTQYRKHLDTFFPLEKSVKQYFFQKMCILLYYWLYWSSTWFLFMVAISSSGCCLCHGHYKKTRKIFGHDPRESLRNANNTSAVFILYL